MRQDLPDKKAAEDALGRILGCKPDSLPTLPATALEISRVASDPDAAVPRLVRVISQDPPLASRLITMANSAAFSPRVPVTEIERAVVLMGLSEVANLAVGLSMISTFGAAPLKRRIQRAQLWKHSFASGILAEMLGRQVLGLGSGYFLYGLVHDIGKVAIEAHLPDKFVEVLSTVEREELPWSVAEKRVLGTDHSEIAGLLFAYWGMPAELFHAVAYHHYPWLADNYLDSVALVFLADLMAHHTGHPSFQLKGAESHPLELSSEGQGYLQARGWDLDDLAAKGMADEVAHSMAALSGSGIID